MPRSVAATSRWPSGSFQRCIPKRDAGSAAPIARRRHAEQLAGLFVDAAAGAVTGVVDRIDDARRESRSADFRFAQVSATARIRPGLTPKRLRNTRCRWLGLRPTRRARSIRRGGCVRGVRDHGACPFQWIGTAWSTVKFFIGRIADIWMISLTRRLMRGDCSRYPLFAIDRCNQCLSVAVSECSTTNSPSMTRGSACAACAVPRAHTTRVNARVNATMVPIKANAMRAKNPNTRIPTEQHRAECCEKRAHQRMSRTIEPAPVQHGVETPMAECPIMRQAAAQCGESLIRR